jgi:hypothetical protein
MLLHPVWAISAADARDQPTVIDLSGTRSWEEIAASGIHYSELKGFATRKAYHLPSSYVAWKFSGGVTFQHHITHGSMDFQDRQLRFMQSHGEMMPLDEIMILARQLHSLLSKPVKPLEQLEKWAAEQGVKGSDGNNFMFGVRECEPEIDVEIRHSLGGAFPWKLVIHASWESPKKTKPNAPLPFKEAALMNLDPPSGRRYTPADDLRAYQEMHGYKETGPVKLWRDPPGAVRQDEDPKPGNKPNPGAAFGDGASPWWLLWFGGALLLAVLIFAFVKRDRTRSHND